MNILLTGGTGFLGSEIIDYFSRKHKIYAIYRNKRGIVRRNVIWIKLDLMQKQDFDDVKKFLDKKGVHIDIIIHAGGATPNRAYADGSFDATTVGTRNLVDFAKSTSVNKIVFISSSAIDFSNGPYSSSKKSAEKIILKSGLNCIILRPEAIIGPGAKDFNRMADMIHKHTVFPMIGSGKNFTQPIAVSDLLYMIEKSLNTQKLSKKIYSAVGKDILTMRELVQKISLAKSYQSQNNSGFASKKIHFIPIPLWLAYPLAWIAGIVYPKAGLNCERVKILSSSRRYSLDYLKEFGMTKNSLTSFDDMIRFLGNNKK